eukprot:1983022-Amphidinium_carterae.2
MSQISNAIDFQALMWRLPLHEAVYRHRVPSTKSDFHVQAAMAPPTLLQGSSQCTLQRSTPCAESEQGARASLANI